MSESSILKYVHVNSVNRRAGDTKSRLTVQVPQGLENCSRVALKSFSIPNTFPNTVNKKIEWIEMVQTVESGSNKWKSALFTIRLDDLNPDQQYIDNLTLQSVLQTKFNNEANAFIEKTDISEDGLAFTNSGQLNHQVGTETEMPITITYDSENFIFKISGKQNSATKHKFMILYDDESDESLWPTMGYDSQKLIKQNEISQFLSESYQSLVNSPTALDYNNGNNLLLKDLYAKDMRDVAENTEKFRSIYAPHASKHENHIGKINLSSDLASDSFIMGDNGILRNTDILESIVNNIPKFSYIHHAADTLYFHNLNRSDVTKFDLRLYQGDDMKQLVDEVLPDWNAVLVFEQNIEIEYHRRETERLNDYAYTVGHPTR